MMRDESNQILDDILARWHSYCRGFKLSGQAASPMFRDSKRAKGEQTLDAISEDTWEQGIFRALDFHVGELEDSPRPYRTAIYVNARNCYTGRAVWLSPRLPQNPLSRAQIVAEARALLVRRLVAAGVM